jgi:enoyl-CoA hydratase
MGLPEISLGTYMGGAVTKILPRIIGLAKARELIFTGRQFDAAEAHAMGLAARVFSAPDFAAGVRAFAELIGSRAPVSLRFAKQHLNDMEQDYAARLEAELAALRACMLTEDWHEGVAAFAEKRPPVFKGS